MSLPEYERLLQSAEWRRPSSSTNLAVVEEEEATGEVAGLYAYFRSHFGRPDVPGILKCFATHPPLLRHMMNLSESLIFSDGHLGRRHKEMIATLISSENACAYCADSHAYFLRIHGGSSGLVCALQSGDLSSSLLTVEEQALLTFVQKVNDNSHGITSTDVDVLKRAGWNEPQIAEATHFAALFAAFNRVANTFGLASQGLLALYESAPDAKADETASVERSAS
jgi:uncharacterized peroxidase-related enzyme